MCAEETDPQIDVYQSRRFAKVFNALTDQEQKLVDDEIERIIDAPEIGERKKGDLSYVWIHKFFIAKQQYLLGYNWQDNKLTLYLLSLGTHENYYNELKRHRKVDLKLIS